MKKLIVLAALIVQVCNAGSLFAQKTQSRTMEQEVIATHVTMLRAIKEKDGNPLRAIIEDNLSFTSATAEVWNKARFIDGFVLNPQIGFPEFNSSERVVRLYEKTAILTALYHIRITRKPGADPEELYERVTETYIKINSKWKLMAMQATFVTKK